MCEDGNAGGIDQGVVQAKRMGQKFSIPASSSTINLYYSIAQAAIWIETQHRHHMAVSTGDSNSSGYHSRRVSEATAKVMQPYFPLKDPTDFSREIGDATRLDCARKIFQPTNTPATETVTTNSATADDAHESGPDDWGDVVFESCVPATPYRGPREGKTSFYVIEREMKSYEWAMSYSHYLWCCCLGFSFDLTIWLVSRTFQEIRSVTLTSYAFIGHGIAMKHEDRV